MQKNDDKLKSDQRRKSPGHKYQQSAAGLRKNSQDMQKEQVKLQGSLSFDQLGINNTFLNIPPSQSQQSCDFQSSSNGNSQQFKVELSDQNQSINIITSVPIYNIMRDDMMQNGRYTIKSINNNNNTSIGNNLDYNTRENTNAKNLITSERMFSQDNSQSMISGQDHNQLQIIDNLSSDESRAQSQNKIYTEQNQLETQKSEEEIKMTQRLKNQRDSNILNSKRERDSYNSDIQFIILSPQTDDLSMFQRLSITSSADASDDVDEVPSRQSHPYDYNSINSQIQDESGDNRFLVRQISFNLISSLKNSNDKPRSSFIQRAQVRLSGRVSEQRSSNNFQYQQQKTSRGQQQNGRFLIVNQKKDSFMTLSKHSFLTNEYLRTEDFHDDVNECNSQKGEIKHDFINVDDRFSPGDRISSVFMNRQPSQEDEKLETKKNQLNAMITKVPQSNDQVQNVLIVQDNQQNGIPFFELEMDSLDSDEVRASDLKLPGSQDVHQIHFLQTLAALKNISTFVTPDISEIEHLMVDLPPFDNPNIKKTLIFDMDETLIHCVDDIETEDPDVIIPILFDDDDEPVQAGINVRPYIYECIREAKKHFQVGVFTASHKTYADAILDFLDPHHKLFDFRFYRDSCVHTSQGYYVKDLRIFRNRDLKDIVIVDNSIYAFGFQIDNGVPIISYYNNKSNDEEMQHMIYYIQCLADVDDIRELNKEAFELSKLKEQHEFMHGENGFSTQQQENIQNKESQLQNEMPLKMVTELDEDIEILNNEYSFENEDQNEDQELQIKDNLTMNLTQNNGSSLLRPSVFQ
ncbi:nli interacting factor-like phosphatase family protein [Stylonychia lemnae]|uniref:Nli interacting factor-like phosphatase family protein n=1 Tax=Stylonychia lemnae TaxID=5949 RepID=A0A077ZW11_STYLE|nr:nli interacting factor-like phosphatase family protein [Stylonychia lemnae]|eukprot:CDW73776.1 nli interacting factor-like phosphatase family protein [Stylonychia lemnae]